MISFLISELELITRKYFLDECIYGCNIFKTCLKDVIIVCKVRFLLHKHGYITSYLQNKRVWLPYWWNIYETGEHFACNEFVLCL